MSFNGFMPLDEKRKTLSTKEKKLIRNILSLRKEANVTQEELSFRIGKNSNYMGMVESYRRGLSLETIFKIADALDVNTSEFFKDL